MMVHSESITQAKGQTVKLLLASLGRKKMDHGNESRQI